MKWISHASGTFFRRSVLAGVASLFLWERFAAGREGEPSAGFFPRSRFCLLAWSPLLDSIRQKKKWRFSGRERAVSKIALLLALSYGIAYL